MIKHIDVRDVELGMFIQKLEGSWFKHPFWRSKFLLTDPRMLRDLHESEVERVVIDASKGLDVGASPPQPAAARPPSRSAARALNLRAYDETPTSQPEVLPAEPPQVIDLRSTGRLGMSREFGNALAVAAKSQKVISKVFLQSRLGKSIEPSLVEPVVENIFASIQRNPHAFNGLMRCKRDNQFMYGHALAVSALMISLARQLKMPYDEISIAGTAGLMLDVGVNHLPVDLASLGGDFRKVDEAILRDHPKLGHDFLTAALGEMPAEIATVCLQHHEYLDGSGYPAGLAGDDLGQLARMAAICDHYDWMVSDGSVANGMSPAKAIQILSDMAGKFDPVILQNFIEMMGSYPIGTFLRLRSGRLAMVVDQSPRDFRRPLVRSFYAIDSGKMTKPEDIALDDPGAQDEIIGVGNPAEFGIMNVAQLRERTFTNACKAAA